MKSTIFVVMMCVTMSTSAQTNVGIGTPTPDASARLDVTATDKGILIPRLALNNVTIAAPVTSPATGLMVWNTNTSIVGGNGAGFYFWDGSRWQSFLSETTGWKLTGNAS